MICPNCGARMDINVCRLTWDCENCPMIVSQLEATTLCARSPQEAADLKMADMIYRGWTPYKERDDA